MIPTIITLYIVTSFLVTLHLIDVKLDDRHSISLLQLITLQAIGAKGIYYKDWLSFTPVFLIGSADFYALSLLVKAFINSLYFSSNSVTASLKVIV